MEEFKLALFLLLAVTVAVNGNMYYIGVGRADITGPAAEVVMMGYAKLDQKDLGIHFRQWSRAFIISDGSSTVVFISADVCMATQLMKMRVVEKLKRQYGNLYTESNVCISSTHTHSGPSGYFQYFLYNLPGGFYKDTLDSIVNGIVKSVQIAHNTMTTGYLYINSGILLDANINRSPTAYMLNPDAKRYKHNTDKMMTILKLVDANGTPLGIISWFAVHCTSMKNTNTLISGDNKGYASMLFEMDMNPNDINGQGKFVAAFAQSNEGDVSPNTMGSFCTNNGKSCNNLHSSCNGNSNICESRGPGRNMFESTQIIGEKQYSKAKELFDAATVLVTGAVQFRHTFKDFTKISFVRGGRKVSTCKPAMGLSFAAGTTDGPGDLNVKQGTTRLNLFWRLARNALRKPTAAQIRCHAPKPILMDTGGLSKPYPWQPNIVPLQIFTIGQLVMIAVPGEFTTMAGRRLRNSVSKVLKDNHFNQHVVPVIAGLSNTYTSYVTTIQEYQQQRYEAASTIYGPNTLGAHIYEFNKLAKSLAQNTSIDPGPNPPDYTSKLVTFLPPIIVDTVPLFKKFGDVDKNANKRYCTNKTVTVRFLAGDPRNRVIPTFLTVEQKQSNRKWKVILNDASWDTMFRWKRTNLLLGRSTATVEWRIAPDTSPGEYRIRHFGTYKRLFGGLRSYSGTSRQFTVAKC